MPLKVNHIPLPASLRGERSIASPQLLETASLVNTFLISRCNTGPHTSGKSPLGSHPIGAICCYAAVRWPCPAAGVPIGEKAVFGGAA